MEIINANPVIMVEVQFTPTHYNAVCRANIPGSWGAEVVNLSDILHLEHWEHCYFYGLGATREEALDTLTCQLKALWPDGGVIRIVRD